MTVVRVLLAISAATFLPNGGSVRIAHNATHSATSRFSPQPTPMPALSEPGISPDGTEIAFVAGSDIWTVPARGGEARLLVSDPAMESRPLYSPDGSRLAFVSTRTGNGDIYVLTLATGQVSRVTFDDQPEQLDGWSHDGRWLYFSSTRDDISGMSDEFRVNANGGTAMPVAGDRYAAEFWGAPSPDGQTLAITARGVSRSQWWRRGHSHLDESEIDLVRDGDGGKPTYTPIVGMGARSGWPMWGDNGATIYFVSDRTGSPNLWSLPVRGGDPRQLTHFTDGRVLWPTISADGRGIVFERDFGIWRYDIGTGNAAQVAIALRGSPSGAGTTHLTLTKGIQELALSPDGKKIAIETHGQIFAASARDGGAATRVTKTSAAEQQPVWSPDSRRVAYSSDREGPSHIYVYDFATSSETQLTHGSGDDILPHWSPDGRSLAYTRDGHELRLIDLASHGDRLLATGVLGRAPFVRSHEMVFSPDGRWIAYLNTAPPRDFTNAYVVSTTGGTARPVTFLANGNANAIAWSTDGTYLLLQSGQRTEQGQLVRVDLVPRTPHFREDQFHELFQEQTPRLPTPQSPRTRDTTQSSRTDSSQAASLRGVRDSAASTDSAITAQRSTAKNVRISFDGIRERLSLLPVELSVSDIAISPDGKSVLLTAVAAGQTNLYVYPLDPLAKEPAVPRQLTSTSGRKGDAYWSHDSKEVFYLNNGEAHVIPVETRTDRALTVSAEMDVDFAREKMEVFEEAWRDLRSNFVDANMNGVNWDAVHTEYAERIAGSANQDDERRILSLMVGELNSSHSGIGGPAAQQPYTGHLGIRFDRAEYERTGHLRVTELVPLSPAEVSGIHVGDYLRSVNGTAVDAHTNLDALMAYTTGHKTTIGISPSASAAPHDVTVLPVDATTAKGLLYRGWVESRRAYVAKISGGRLGYVHMYDMSANALDQLYADLDDQNMSRDGVVVDVRNNNGGFVNVYAMDVLSRRPYLTMQRRGSETIAPARSVLGQRALERPTVLVTNQHTLSDGEDFTQGYEALKLGKVVGEPTGGWIIYTSAATLIDGTTERLPFTRVRTLDGQPMEMHPRPVDVPVLRAMGESYSGRDSQLDTAVKELLAQIGASR